MSKSLLLSLFLLISFHVFSQVTYQEIIDTFFELYETKNSDEAIEYIFETNPWIKKTDPLTQKIKESFNKALPIIGDYHGKELVSEKWLGECFIESTYIVKYSRQPILFKFTLYKPDSVWQVHNFRFDDKLDEELGN
ncbi:MAG: hypothetical protein C0594_03610 [Marinilabiliales bacterium]|nr:MAG: hypothetical protein C0594_03610 [Marinilabiliales bacterium]